MSAVVTELPTIDPAGMTRAQRTGQACVSCDKRWPAPTVLIGQWPDGEPARCCPECAPEVTRHTRREDHRP